MKPKTKLEIRVTELSAKLRPITEKQELWGEDHCIKKWAHRSKNTMYCLECGHSWKADGTDLFDTVLGIDCPECGRHLEKIQNYSTNCSHAEYFQVWQTVSDFQVIRTIFVRKIYRLSSPTCTLTSEVMQHWIDQSGKVVWLSKTVQGLSQYYDQWVLSSELSVKHLAPYTSSETRYWLSSNFVYPFRSILPIIKRNGFNGHLYSFNPVYLFPLLLAEPHVETLFKARQFSLIRHIKNTNENWASVKICLRNGYIVKDASVWFDHLDLLAYFGKDLHNAKYVCPDNLTAEHSRLIEKKREIIDREELKEKRQRAHEQNEKFLAMKSQFIGLKFIGDQITVKTLDSVQEYMEEGDRLHHCVFTNEYFLKPESLCLSARIDEQPIETIEVNLKKMKIEQARGKHNQPSEYHDQIMQLMSANLPRIAKIAKQLQTATI
jgi:hypothetical protein